MQFRQIGRGPPSDPIQGRRCRRGFLDQGLKSSFDCDLRAKRFGACANHDELDQLPCENSNSAHEHQDQQNYDYETQAAAAVIAGTVEWRAANAADATEKDQNQNDEKDCPDRHEFAPSILPSSGPN